MIGLSITLPWPSKDLSPNTSLHHMAHYRAKKSAKNAAWGFTKALMPKMGIAHKSWRGHVTVHTAFHPPAGYRYDEDNLVARMKAFYDGIALALGVDDHEFRHTHERGEKDPPNGKVVVTLTPSAVVLPVIGNIK